MTNLNVYVAYRGDRLSDEARTATLADSADDLSRLNQRIQQGNGILKAWAEGHGGRSIAQMGDGGRLEIGADHLHELPQLRQQYEQEVGSSVSVGVGKKLSEAEQALEFAVKSGGDKVELWTEDLPNELESLTDPNNPVKLFASYLDKAEPPLNKPNAGGGMTGPSQSTPAGATPPTPEGSEHSENEALQSMLESQPPAAQPVDLAGQFGQLADESEGAEQEQKQQQAQQQQNEEQSDNVRGAIVEVLKQFKEQGPLWEQLKEAQPEAYKTLTGVIQAMIALAKQVYGGEEEQPEQDVKKSEDDIFDKSSIPLAAPAMHSTVEGFLTQLKGLPKDGPHRGKLITSHMNHGPFLAALQTHPQDKQVHAMLTQFLNSKANAGVGVGAKVMAKIETPQYAPATPEQFEQSIAKADQSQLENPRDYSNKKLWLAHDGNSGYGISHDGELVNVFSLVRGHGHHAVNHAISQGATHLSAFDGHLPKFYGKFGFKEHAREKNWTAGGPDVVFMSLPQVAKAQGKTIPVKHFSTKEGLTELDPKFQGTGMVGAEKNRPKRIPRTYYYERNAAPEGVVTAGAAHQYHGELPAGTKLYDMGADELGLNKPSWKGQVYHVPDLDTVERTLARKGYHGYRNYGVDGALAYFQKLPVKAVARSPILSRKKVAKAGISMTHHALQAGKTGRHQVVLPVGSQIDAAPSASRNVGRIKVADPETGKTKWRQVRAGLVMAPDGTPTSSRNPSGGKE
jgi:hypothetical protein